MGRSKTMNDDDPALLLMQVIMGIVVLAGLVAVIVALIWRGLWSKSRNTSGVECGPRRRQAQGREFEKKLSQPDRN